MKKSFLPCMLILSFITLSSGLCNKSSLPPQDLSEHYPQYWIMTIDESATRYTFLRTNGATMFRKNVDKTYSLITLADEEDCKFEIAQSRNEANNEDCFTIRLDKNKKIWVGAGQSSNKQEIFLLSLNTTADPGDNFKFKLHRMPDENGVKMMAIESLYYPGYYISSAPPGSQYAQNQVTLQQASSPQKATAWACR